MSLIQFLKAVRCPLCFRRERPIIEREANLKRLSDALREKEWAIEQDRMAIADREQVYGKRQDALNEFKSHLLEREMLLDRREKDFIAEKERMVGKDNLEIKSQILLPFLKQKWEAEAKKIDADRIVTLQNTPAVHESVLSKKLELEGRLEILKKKPSTTGNHDLTVEVQSRLRELAEIIEIIDKARAPA